MREAAAEPVGGGGPEAGPHVRLNIERINAAIEERGGTKAILKATGLAHAALRSWRKRKSLPTLTSLGKLAWTLGLDIRDVIISDKRRLIPLDRKVILYMGGRPAPRAQNPPASAGGPGQAGAQAQGGGSFRQSFFSTAAPDLSVADVEAAWQFLSFLRHVQRVRQVKLEVILPSHVPDAPAASALPAAPQAGTAAAAPGVMSPAESMWRSGRNEKAFAVVIGSMRVNGVFDLAYEELCGCFRDEKYAQYTDAGHRDAAHRVDYPLWFAWRRGTAHDDRMMARAMGRYAMTMSDENCGVYIAYGDSDEQMIPRTHMRSPGDGAEYQDIAMVGATEKLIILWGHGTAGTLGAARLLVDNWGLMEDLVRDHHSAILVSPVSARYDKDNRPINPIPRREDLQVIFPLEGGGTAPPATPQTGATPAARPPAETPAVRQVQGQGEESSKAGSGGKSRKPAKSGRSRGQRRTQKQRRAPR